MTIKNAKKERKVFLHAEFCSNFSVCTKCSSAFPAGSRKCKFGYLFILY